MDISELLDEQIREARKTIKSDSYSISLGELVSQYENGEINIRPEFQRLFRWTKRQKSRLIESILLGIPLPSIFVLQRQDGVWELIDGLQRISTILEFVGALKPEDFENAERPLRLEGTEYLPALAGVAYDADEPVLSSGQRLAFRRAKITVTFLLPESDDRARGELFDRLNAGGSQATAQEIRYARFVMEDPDFAKWVTAMANNQEFQNIAGVTDRQKSQAYDVELVCRFLTLHLVSDEELKKVDTIDDLMTDTMLTLLSETNTADSGTPPPGRKATKFRDKIEPVREALFGVFEKTVSVIDAAMGDDAFRRFDIGDGRFKGAFSVSAFEFIMCGVADNIQDWMALDPAERNSQLNSLIRNSWNSPEFKESSGSGKAARNRVKVIVPFGRTYFRPQGN